MGAAFWVRRFLLSFVIAGVVLGALQYVRGATQSEAIAFGFVWGVISSGLFTLIGYVRFRRNPACMLPRGERG